MANMTINRVNVAAVQGYSISSKFPFGVSAVSGVILFGTAEHFDEHFDRRGDAEKASLENFYYFYKQRGMVHEQTTYFNMLKNFDDDPEWLI